MDNSQPNQIEMHTYSYIKDNNTLAQRSNNKMPPQT